jgi:hypothetical protein
MTSEEDLVEFKPRGRTLIIGGLPWLARITDKVRAHLEGRIGDYVYP